jgi:hypothetical protein
MLKRIVGITSLALLPLTASAASLIIPAAGTGPGANGSKWSTDFIIHNASSIPVSIDLVYHDSNGSSKPQSFVVGARTTVTTGDVVRNVFGITSGTGAIEIDADDTTASHIAVTSRTFNTSGNGSIFGQDIPAVNANDAAGAGDLTVLPGPDLASQFRFNFGVYAVTDASITWELVRANGKIEATKELTYKAGTQFQYNNGVAALFGATASDNDVVYATVSKGKVIAYGSTINNISGDPTYVPGLRARADTHVQFGVDVNEDGTIELKDADNDGVLDTPVDLFTFGFPNYFRVVFPGHTNVKVELADPSPNVLLLDDKGTVEWAPPVDQRGTTQSLRLKVTVDGIVEFITIPAKVK